MGLCTCQETKVAEQHTSQSPLNGDFFHLLFPCHLTEFRSWLLLCFFELKLVVINHYFFQYTAIFEGHLSWLSQGHFKEHGLHWVIWKEIYIMSVFFNINFICLNQYQLLIFNFLLLITSVLKPEMTIAGLSILSSFCMFYIFLVHLTILLCTRH